MTQNTPKILGVITARGGSKSIPKKNIVPLLGKPLIAYTIVPALKSKYLTKVLVSSDDPEIIEVSKRYGAEVPFIRPAELATDTALSIDVVIHATALMEEQDNIKYDYIFILQPTTPLRTTADIDGAIEKIIDTGADSVIGVVEVQGRHPARMVKIKDDRLVSYTEEEPPEGMPRQQLPRVYSRSGSVYVTKRDLIMNQRTFKGKYSRPWIIPNERDVDIDEAIDLAVAEVLMRDKDWSHIRPI
ncbi:MAG: cytidylyltransferase domain-containing protein [Candidatus Hodarchaeota archaeon]